MAQWEKSIMESGQNNCFEKSNTDLQVTLTADLSNPFGYKLEKSQIRYR